MMHSENHPGRETQKGTNGTHRRRVDDSRDILAESVLEALSFANVWNYDSRKLRRVR